ncbi:MAG TPA: 4Fe-4S binding protein [Bacillota bacterium]|nr:4Fe-4S binding protein [Bacillota bacterium]HQD77650.1 4Fe-4S binding protein [Bacillota bacterium]
MPAFIHEEECIACGACADVCAVEAITVDEVAHVNPDICIDCGMCVEECPTNCISME